MIREFNKVLVDKKAGIELSFGSKKLYNEIVSAYLGDYPDYIDKLKTYMESSNWKEYTAICQAIKNSSKQIGCDSLYEEAGTMEKAAKSEDELYIKKHHKAFIRNYTAVVNYIKSEFNKDIFFEYSDLEDGTKIDEDILNLIKTMYYKILRVDLNTRKHETVFINTSSELETEAYREFIDEWFKMFAENGLVYDKDLIDYNRQTDIEYLKGYFRQSSEPLVIRYRRKVKDSFIWVSMMLTRSAVYSDKNPVIMLYVRDMQIEMSEDAHINEVLSKSFELVSGENDKQECIKQLLANICQFYKADGVSIVETDEAGKADVLYEYSLKDKKPGLSNWELGLGDAQDLHLEISNPRNTQRSSLVAQSIGGLIYIILSDENSKKQVRVIEGLSNLYYTLYRADISIDYTIKIHAPDYVEKVIGKEGKIEDILKAVTENLVVPEDREKMSKFNDYTKWNEKLKGKNNITIDFSGTNKASVRAFVIPTKKDADGNVTEVIYAVQDISEIKKKEREYNESLKSALDAANSASTAKSSFLSNMSHDIRTPMNAIIGYTNLAAAHIDDKEKLKEYLSNISSANNYMMSLINSVLDMSRIESGRVQLSLTPCNILELISELKQVIVGQVGQKSMNYVANTGDIIHPKIICDSLRLNQILINIIGNSIKYTPDNGTITLTCSEKKSANSKIPMYEFVISDTGIGIDEEFLDHIFEPFEREKNSTISGIQGTGLGMAITKSIVELMNGTIDIKSKLGEGTTVTIQIPFEYIDEISTESLEEIARRNVEELKLASSNIIGTKKEEPKVKIENDEECVAKVLLVEDNLINRKIANEILADYNVSIEEALNGKEAVETIEEKPADYYDIILMDVQMPIMNGYEATRKIRAMEDEAKSKLPIIIMTANAFAEDKQAAFAAGANAHVAKPIDVNELISTMRNFFKDKEI